MVEKVIQSSEVEEKIPGVCFFQQASCISTIPIKERKKKKALRNSNHLIFFSMSAPALQGTAGEKELFSERSGCSISFKTVVIVGDLDAPVGNMNSNDLMLRVLLWVPAHGRLGNICFQTLTSARPCII